MHNGVIVINISDVIVFFFLIVLISAQHILNDLYIVL